MYYLLVNHMRDHFGYSHAHNLVVSFKCELELDQYSMDNKLYYFWQLCIDHSN